MTVKSRSRRDRDMKLNSQSGQFKVMDRKKSAQCWYELKAVHQRSQEYIMKTADLFAQFLHPLVLNRIHNNGDSDRWNELHAMIPVKMEVVARDFQELWEMHRDKKKLCLSAQEQTAAFRIFELYQKFDTDFYLTFSEIINEMKDIFNKALSQLLELQDQLAEQLQKDAQDPTKVTDVVSNEDLAALKQNTDHVEMKPLTPVLDAFAPNN